MSSAAPPHAGEKVLLIKGKGGFGNRILAATTGLVLAELTGRRPVIDWRDGIFLPEGVNLYPLLFDAPEPCVPEAFDRETDVVPAVWSNRLTEWAGQLIDSNFGGNHSSPFIYRKLCLDLAHPETPAKVAVFWSYLPKFARLRARMARHPAFRGRALKAVMREVLARHFTPNDRVRREVDRLFEGRQRPVIGVHIRYTDMKVPLEPIERALEQLQMQMPDSEIFLATDSAPVQDRIMARFANVFVIEKAVSADGGGLHRPGHDDAAKDTANPLREAENALIDLWALSRCDWLIHSSRSTFSTFAALVGNIPAERQMDMDRFNPQIRLKQLFQAYA